MLIFVIEIVIDFSDFYHITFSMLSASNSVCLLTLCALQMLVLLVLVLKTSD